MIEYKTQEMQMIPYKDRRKAVSFNGNFLKRLAQAAKKMEPDKEYTLTEIERLLRDSENA